MTQNRLLYSQESKDIRSNDNEYAYDYCSWFGITCEFGEIVEISLSTLGITSGTIPSSLFNLTSITSLDLSYNGFVGTIPSYQLSNPNLKLATLNFGSNKLSGSFPIQLLFIPSLLTLDLSSNSLTGQLIIGSNESAKLSSELLD